MVKNENKIKVLICSVGEYGNYEDLQSLGKSSISDKRLMINSLINGIDVKKENIIDCSKTTRVTYNQFKDASNYLNNSSIAILYFSGHGGIRDNKYNFCFSDRTISLDNIIKDIKQIDSSEKIIFLDSCHSGTDAIEDYYDSLDYNFEDKNNEAYLFFASSNINELSSVFNDTSMFTKCLSDAIDDRLNKNPSIFDIVFLTYLYLKGGKVNQHCMLRTNIIGDIFFRECLNETPLVPKEAESNDDDLKINQLCDIEAKLVKEYESIKKNYIEFFSNEISLEELKEKFNSSNKIIYETVNFDLQNYKCLKHGNYQECLDSFGHSLYAFILSFTKFKIDEIYQHYNAKDKIKEMAEYIYKMKNYRSTYIN